MNFIEITEKVIEGKFIERLNRFVAKVLVEEKEELVHVPTSGRLKELLLPGADIYLRVKDFNGKRKTNFDLLHVKSKEGVWVCLDSHLPNTFMEKLLLNSSLEEFSYLQRVEREVKYKNSRFDFFVVDKAGCPGFIEVKSVTLVEDGVAKFPDAPSTRGARHLEELIEAVKEGYKGSVVFMVQRNDPSIFSPNKERDLDFTKSLIKAVEKGVKAYCYSCEITRNRIFLDKVIPIKLF
ncbi:DNA/RNA nuclease SfsA [Anaerobranca gottschalkii]|uniref:Sugar fermentation stimulation protein homolog n=1 Tax=Anaerobranca gottschalkii DSM 13577 TaxID=1120990 RepID=A0A1I0AJU5_9FIRM|nr:DNA/RNA nuclease SfsA [Anaerobranca gottschalkii]SES94578.1 sugar fermentation stimulation protein A [Anaerobranca gottschalkii DSM 13577]